MDIPKLTTGIPAQKRSPSRRRAAYLSYFRLPVGIPFELLMGEPFMGAAVPARWLLDPNWFY
ncbi:hypothetical protein Cflav_PD4056 [Pedosphaera parvula Ellin514]|uniref:Uncharacterized protein n=1 Tax=Pedosphaera parvula (strain Ellin514) TaxID=320771 RepID=B9XGW6_PEDPL|nr:hypothetical protein Cflav_PD4056 [Pedosphaera parvula Ellin514]